MKVLIVTFEFVPFSGGIARYTYEIARGMAALDCQVTVLAPTYNHCKEIDAQSNFKTIRMPVRHDGKAEFLRFLPGLKSLNRQIVTSRPDVVLLTSDLAHGLGAVVCVRNQVPFAAVIHGSEIVKHFPPKSLRKYFQYPSLKFCYTRAGVVFCVSRYVRNLMLEAGFDGSKLFVVHNGIDEKLLSIPYNTEAVTALRQKHGLKNKKVILTIARLTARKGQDQMIRSMPALLTKDPNVCYILIGTGEDKNDLEKLVQEVGIKDAVIFTGEIAEAEKIHYLDLCDAFVLLSRNDGQRVEGLGISLLEATARAKPLIASSHGGIKEIVKDGVNGFFVDPRNYSQVADRIARILQDANLAKHLGESAKETVAENFTTSQMAQKTTQRLAALLISKDRKHHHLSSRYKERIED